MASSRSRSLRLSLDVDARIRLCRTHTKSIQLPLLDKSSNKMEPLLVSTSSSPHRHKAVATLVACPTKMTCNHLCSPTACRMPMMTINNSHILKCPAKTHSCHLCPCLWVVQIILPRRTTTICNSEARQMLISKRWMTNTTIWHTTNQTCEELVRWSTGGKGFLTGLVYNFDQLQDKKKNKFSRYHLLGRADQGDKRWQHILDWIN